MSGSWAWNSLRRLAATTVEHDHRDDARPAVRGPAPSGSAARAVRARRPRTGRRSRRTTLRAAQRQVGLLERVLGAGQQSGAFGELTGDADHALHERGLGEGLVALRDEGLVLVLALPASAPPEARRDDARSGPGGRPSSARRASPRPSTPAATSSAKTIFAGLSRAWPRAAATAVIAVLPRGRRGIVLANSDGSSAMPWSASFSANFGRMPVLLRWPRKRPSSSTPMP